MNGERINSKECDGAWCNFPSFLFFSFFFLTVHGACRWGSDHEHVTLGQFQHHVDQFKVKLLSFCCFICSCYLKGHLSSPSAVWTRLSAIPTYVAASRFCAVRSCRTYNYKLCESYESLSCIVV